VDSRVETTLGTVGVASKHRQKTII